jgi:DNA-binding beta-propeller fold protein YncE
MRWKISAPAVVLILTASVLSACGSSGSSSSGSSSSGGSGSSPSLPATLQVTSRNLQFDAGAARDILADPARHLVYISIRNEIVVLSSDSLLIQNELFVGSSPAGLALSADDQKLYVALGAGGSLVVVDLTTYATTTIEIAAQIGASYLSGVLELQPGVVLVSGQLLVTVNLNSNNQITVVPGGLNVGTGARLRASLDGRYVYVGIPAPNAALYKLDNRSPALPVIASNLQVGGDPTGMALDTAGGALIIGGNETFDTSTLAQENPGYSSGVIGELSDDSQNLQQFNGQSTLYSGATLHATTQITTDCPQEVLNGIASVGLNGEWLINGSEGDLCAISTTQPNAPPGEAGSVALAAPPSTQWVATTETVVGNFPYDMAFDPANDRFYVTVPQSNELVFVAANEGGVVTTLAMPGQPGHVIASADGVHLYVGLLDQGSIVVVDRQTVQVVQTIDLSTLLGQDGVGSLFELSPGNLFVGGPPSNTNVAMVSYAVELNPANPSAAQRIGNAQGYCFPFFAASPDTHYLYIDGAGCNTIIEKRDLTTPGLPVVMTSASVDQLSLQFSTQSADGSRLYIYGTYIVDASTLRVVGAVSDGAPFLSTDGTQLLASQSFYLYSFNLVTQQPLALLGGNCQSWSANWGDATQFMWPDQSHWAILSIGDIGDPGSVCVMSMAPQ